MSVSFNLVVLIGNLTRDPELRYTPSGMAVCHFTLAVNMPYKTKDGEKREDVLFIDVEVWEKQAETCAEFLKKGRSALVMGQLKLDKWTSTTGEARSKIKVRANNVRFLTPKSSGAEPEEGVHKPVEGEPSAPLPPEEPVTESDNPF